MMQKRKFIANLELVKSRKLEMSKYSVVECGVWKGGASFALMGLLPECSEFHLFDSFEGLPEPTERDGLRASQLSKENLFVNGRNYSSEDEVIDSIIEFGFSDRAKVHKGWFDETVRPENIHRPIGLLRLDGDWYDSTRVVLDRLFAFVAPGGLVILDDYFDWPGCSQAVHDFLSKNALPDTIRTYDEKVAFIVKKPNSYLQQSVSRKELKRRRKMNW